MVIMATSPAMRAEMAECGYRRVMKRYQLQQMKRKYWELYRKMAAKYECDWSEDDFDIREHREK